MARSDDRLYREISKRLGVSLFGLDLLFRLKRGDCVTGGNAGPVLARKGLVSGFNAEHWCWCERPQLTAAGLALCEQARALGY